MDIPTVAEFLELVAPAPEFLEFSRRVLPASFARAARVVKPNEAGSTRLHFSTTT